VLGVSSGASPGAVAAILLGGLPLVGTFSTQVSAFSGAIIAGLLVFAFSGGGGKSASRLVLTGMAISAAFAALTNLSSDTHKINSAVASRFCGR
jgi:iron complex transport system permease protein